MDRLRREGCAVARTSGSHGIFDVIAIDKVKKTIMFIQAKPKSMSKNAKMKLEKEHQWLNDNFDCKFKVISLYAELNEIGGK
jgi:Holliday junction resolvase